MSKMKIAALILTVIAMTAAAMCCHKCRKKKTAIFDDSELGSDYYFSNRAHDGSDNSPG